ncbi:MAG: hypothetical protein ACFUZC_04520 [Chthoniobacteraceae bacterium]
MGDVPTFNSVASERGKLPLSALIEEEAIVLTGSGSTATYKIPARTKRKR